MKIVDIRETVVPIKSPIRNAFIDFSQMTVSVLALVTDVIRDGKPVLDLVLIPTAATRPVACCAIASFPALRPPSRKTLLGDDGDNFELPASGMPSCAMKNLAATASAP